ncbi:MAG: geranylgeranyl diphosphate synthase type II [Verrucomicrobiales bacterium]|jgi:geranylgeranyl diphosphate synthase type II
MSGPPPSDYKTLKLPKSAPVTTTRFRPPKKNIPQTKTERDALLKYVRDYIDKENLVPPMPLDELGNHADNVLRDCGFDQKLYRDYTAVLLANEAWRETLATIPYERRLLLMPKCLRVEEKCPAPFDEFGLLCKQCGLCTIEDFQNEAERLGYAVLVAEGSAVVMSLIQTGKIEAIVGISCLPVLERTFPYVEAAAVPSIAVPLLQDDCINTTVDNDWVWDYIHLTSDDKTRRLNLNQLHDDVRTWFSREAIDEIMGEAQGHAEETGRDWLAKDGKRWRPFLTVAAYQALREDPEEPIPDGVKKIAIAVEAFHKASLIHDDIEDEDHERYGEATLHETDGIPVALNAGDLLIGEGYRLIGEAGIDPKYVVEMLQVAAEGQRELCRGQGAELAWARNPLPLKTTQVLEIFRQKTAPAFDVALKLGAAFAGKLDDVSEALGNFSESLGIAYQIRDDLDDLSEDAGENYVEAFRPSVLLAKAREMAKGETKEWMTALWNRQAQDGTTVSSVRQLVHEVGADDKCVLMLETYKQEAIRSLAEVENANLKGLLRRVIGKIFNDLEIKGWCREFEMKHGVREGEESEGAAPAAAEAILAGVEA